MRLLRIYSGLESIGLAECFARVMGVFIEGGFDIGASNNLTGRRRFDGGFDRFLYFV